MPSIYKEFFNWPVHWVWDWRLKNPKHSSITSSSQKTALSYSDCFQTSSNLPYASPHNFDDILDGDDAVLGRGDLRHDDGHDLSVVVVVLKVDVGVVGVEIDAFVVLKENEILSLSQLLNNLQTLSESELLTLIQLSDSHWALLT